MKIGIQVAAPTISFYGGVNVQGRMWAEGLRKRGHEVILINMWEQIDYNSMDIILLLGMGKPLLDYFNLYRKFSHPKIVSAPIIDFEGPMWKFKLLARYYGSLRLRYYKPLHDYYKIVRKFDGILVRSEFEKSFITDGFKCNDKKIHIVPISMRFDNAPEVDFSLKEDICLHVSRLAFPGKNVEGLVKAAIKYGFKLQLAGTINGTEKQWLDKLIADKTNISYIGWLSEEDLISAYKKAKVFALPSFIEGVGMVALEAAVYGCEIALTDIGAPKEYYEGRAVLVDPYNIDSIGKGVLEAMNSKKAQPELRDHILKNYNLDSNMAQLEKAFNQILQN